MGMQRVLVVEDDEPVAMMLSAVLEYLGYTSVVVASCEEALKVAAYFRPQVMLVGLDGRSDFVPGGVQQRSLPASYPEFVCSCSRPPIRQWKRSA